MSVPGGGWGPPSQPPGGGGGWTPQPPHVAATSAASEPSGTWAGVILSVLFLVGSFLACVVTGFVAIEESERFAMQVAMVTVPTILAGLFPWIVALLVRKKGTGLAVGAPIGCGCLTWVVSLVGVFVFFEVIWPAL